MDQQQPEQNLANARVSDPEPVQDSTLPAMNENPTVEPNPDPLLTIYSFDTSPTRYSYSPFVTKLHFRLRYAGIPYINAFGSKFEAPKGKIPYVKFHPTGEIQGDSGLILHSLKSSSNLQDVNVHLDAKKRATDLALRKAVEDGAYFVTLYERWYDNYHAMRDQGPFGLLPWGIRHVITALAYRYARAMLYMQGTGRYTAEEVALLREEMVGMLADFAEASRGAAGVARDGYDGGGGGKDDEPFWILGGESPTEADFTVFGYLAGLVGTVTQPATTALIKSHPALVEYIERIHHRYFPDFELGVLEVTGTGKLHVE